MYKCPRARVFLSSDHSTDWFDCPSGVKQGDNVSPTLFSIFINDLVKGINELGVGVKIDNRVEVDGTIIDNSIILSCLLYADDLVFLSETEENLQKMLDFLYKWCCDWRIEVNLDKTNIMHVRKPHCRRCHLYTSDAADE